jgi:hypothetical protein
MSLFITIMDISAIRQKPGIWRTPYSSQNIQRGLLGARTIVSPIHLPAFDKPDGIHWYITNYTETVPDCWRLNL